MTAVSVIIPVYQGEATISAALSSVLDQSYSDLEIIVVDDGSTDGTIEALMPFEGKIKLIREKHRGVSAARNRGLQKATGDFIAFLDADDIWMPEKLDLQMNLFSKKPELISVYSNVYFLYKGIVQNRTYFDLQPPHRGDIFFHLFEVNFIPFSSVIIRSESLKNAGLFNETIGYGEDYDLLLRLSRLGKFDYVREPVAQYRTDGGQTGSDCVTVESEIIAIKERTVRENNELFRKKDKRFMDRAFYRRYLSLALCHLYSGERDKASLMGKEYIRRRGVSVIGMIFQMLMKLPPFIRGAVIGLWKKTHRRPELGRF